VKAKRAIQPRLSGRAYAFGAVLLMSLAPIFVKIGFRQALNPVPLLTLRFWVAALAYWLFLSIYNRPSLRLERKHLKPLVVVSVFFTLAYLLYYLALVYVDASVAHMLAAINPSVVLLLLFLDGRSVGRRSVVRLLLVLVGLYFLVRPGGDINPLGVALGLGMTVFYGAFLFWVEKYLDQVSALTIGLYLDSFVAILFTLIYLVQYGAWQPISGYGWLVILFTGLLSTALGHFLYVSAVKQIGSGETALINPFETVFTVLWALIFLGDRLSGWQWLGGAMILLSAFLIGRPVAVQPVPPSHPN
jgi:drug/metabolite transporter (DMT)-like permease